MSKVLSELKEISKSESKIMSMKQSIVGSNLLNESLEFDMFNEEEDQHVVDRDIVCTEFAPDVFAHLRAIDGYTI